MSNKGIGLAISEAGTARGRVASFCAAPFGYGTKNSAGKITSFTNLFSDAYFHRLFLNTFVWAFRRGGSPAGGEDFKIYITEPENDYIKAYFDHTLVQGGLNAMPVNTFARWSFGDPWMNVTGGVHQIVWMPPWYAADSTANIEDYHKAAIFIILPSSNAQFGTHMPNDRQAAIIRSVADMSAEGPSVSPGMDSRKRFYNAFGGDFRGAGLITFEWFHYLQKVRQGGAFTIDDENDYVGLYDPDDRVHRGFAESSSLLVDTISGVYDLTPIDVDRSNIILSASEEVIYTQKISDNASVNFQEMIGDSVSYGIPDIIETTPEIETESYDATISRLPDLKPSGEYFSGGVQVFSTNVAAIAASTTTTTSTTTTPPPGGMTKVGVATVRVIDSCGPYNMFLRGENASYFTLENHILYVNTTELPTGKMTVDVVFEDHFRPKRFPDIVRPYTIEFDQCVAPIVANRTGDVSPAYSWRSPQSLSLDDTDQTADPFEYLWPATAPSLIITPFDGYKFSGDGLDGNPFKVCLKGKHLDNNTFWMRVQDYIGIEFPYTIKFKVYANTSHTADDISSFSSASARENVRLLVNSNVPPNGETITIGMEPNPTDGVLQFTVNGTQGTSDGMIDPSGTIFFWKEIENRLSLNNTANNSNTRGVAFDEGIIMSLTDPANGGATPIQHGQYGVDIITQFNPWKAAFDITYSPDLVNPITYGDQGEFEEDGFYIYHEDHIRCVAKVLFKDVKPTTPKQHYYTIDELASTTNSLKSYLPYHTNVLSRDNYDSDVFSYYNDWDDTLPLRDWRMLDNIPDVNNPFKEYPYYPILLYHIDGYNSGDSGWPQMGGIVKEGEFVVHGPAASGVDIVFCFEKGQHITSQEDEACLELTVNAAVATTTTTTTTSTTTTTTTTTLPPYCFEVELIEINPVLVPPNDDCLDGSIDAIPASQQGENANSIKVCGVREGDDNVVFNFPFTANANHVFDSTSVLNFTYLESNPPGFVSYTTQAFLDFDKKSGDARITITSIPPIGTIGERKYLKLLLCGNTIPTTTTTTTTPAPTTTTTTTTTASPCNGLIDIFCKQTIRCTYNSFTDSCDSEIIDHEIVGETCCSLSDSTITTKINDYLTLNPTEETECLNNTTLFAPCNDPNENNECETIIEEYKFIASISCT